MRTSRRHQQADATRTLLLRTAEKLYAERGIFEVSNRMVAEAAGSANNSAVAYHVGSKIDLLGAISAEHSAPIANQMRAMLDSARGSGDVRSLVACLVRPYSDHLESLGTPSWFARLTAQIASDPGLGDELSYDGSTRHVQQEVWAAIADSLPDLPVAALELRRQMVRVMVLFTCAEQERAAATSRRSASWAQVGAALVDAGSSVLISGGGV